VKWGRQIRAVSAMTRDETPHEATTGVGWCSQARFSVKPIAGLFEIRHADPSARGATGDAEFPEQYAKEVLIFDLERDRQLEAAALIVSPANKGRPESRQLFVAKCFNLLRQDVCLSIVDLGTVRQFNFYTERLAPLDRRGTAFRAPVPPIYAVTSRKRKVGRQSELDT
jgi:hypothetical protein